MKRITLALLIAALFTLSGCASSNVKEALGNLHTDCARHYAGAIGGGIVSNATLTFTIDCAPEGSKPETAKPAAVVTPAPAPAATPHQ